MPVTNYFNMNEGMEMKKIILALGMFLYLGSCLASPEIESKVIYVGINSNNVVFVQFDKVIEEPGCSSVQLVLPPESAIKEKILSVALAAKASGALVSVKAKGCYNGQPSLLPDASDWGFLFIK